MVAIPASRFSRRDAIFWLAEQRKYSKSQKEMAIGSPHLFWINPTNRCLPKVLRLGVWETSEGKCVYCNTILNDNTFTVDHIHPLARGGTDDIENLAIA